MKYFSHLCYDFNNKLFRYLFKGKREVQYSFPSKLANEFSLDVLLQYLHRQSFLAN